MNQLDKATQENAASSEEVAASLEEMSSQAESLSVLAQELGYLVHGQSNSEQTETKTSSHRSSHIEKRKLSLVESKPSTHQLKNAQKNSRNLEKVLPLADPGARKIGKAEGF